jgi:carotenoid cleavage dioxygenase-like enzyme
VANFEEPQSPKIIFGSIPEDLVGTLAINGAGRIRIGARMLGHWFDGDGFITTLSFDGRSNYVKVFGKYAQTARYRAQQDSEINDPIARDEEYKPPLAFSGAWTKAGECVCFSLRPQHCMFVSQSSFLLGNGNFWENIGRIPKNPSNTAVMWLPPSRSVDGSSSAPRLFALCEGGHPIELDPTTLNVVQNEQPFRSSPSAASRETISSFFSAHPSFDPNDSTIYNHGYTLLNIIAPPSINLMKLSPDGDVLQQVKSEMPYNSFVHDATISQSYMVYFVCPYLIPTGMDAIPLVLGTESLGGLMTWKGGHYSTESERLKSYLHVHAKKDLSLKWRIEIPHPATVFHVVDAFEEELDDGDIVLKVRASPTTSRLAEKACDRPLLERQFANQYAVPIGTRLHSTLKEYTFLLRNSGSGKGEFLDCVNIGAKSRTSIPCDYPITNRVGGHVRLRYVWVDTIAPSSVNDWFDAVQKVDMDNGNFSSDAVTFGEGVVSYLFLWMVSSLNSLSPHILFYYCLVLWAATIHS